ncbi:MAG: ABC transporter permease [Saprospiraceae bacterium]
MLLQNYFKIAVRNLRNHRVYTLLNVLGLGLSVACSVLIFLLLRHHLSYDTYHEKRDRIGRVVTDVNLEAIMPLSGVPNPMAKALREEYSFLEKTAMRAGNDQAIISVPTASNIPDKYKEQDVFAFAEPELFDILDIPLKTGSAEALREPNTALITERLARKYYGDADPIGKSFRLDNKMEFRVAGILKDLPDNTDYHDEILASWITRKTYPPASGALDNWGGVNSDTYCFVLMQPGHSIDELNGAMPEFQKKYQHPDRADLFMFKTLPLTALHFNGDYGEGVEKHFLWAMGLIGLFLLITACVNFINMATAQALGRAREVGVRKSLGSTRKQLFWQFMFETGLIVVAGVLAGTGMAAIGLPRMNALMESTIRMGGGSLFPLVLFLILLATLLIFLAGAYPGVVQARFQPVDSLKGVVQARQKGSLSLRRVLVTAQFAISQILIIGAAVVTAQMQYAQSADWGFRPGAVLTVPVPLHDQARMNTMRQQIASIAGVKNTSLCFQPPASGSNNQTGVRYDTRPEEEAWIVNSKPADDRYLATFGLQLVAGRNLQPSDTAREFIVNETFVKKLNLASPEEVLHKNITIDGVTAPVVGVVHDFHNWTMSQPISAIVICSNAASYESCAIELESGNPAPVLAQVKKVWENTYPEHYYEQMFMEERLGRILQKEDIFFRLTSTFALIAIFIGCLGLYGLSAFMVARKTKEIGIRKTLGASVPNVLWIFGREYVRLLLIAFLVAAPIAWWAMNAWLADYAYRASFGIEIMGGSLLLSAAVALLTVGVQSVRAALANPVRSLRSE